MSREEEDEVHSVGSMPVLTVRSEVEDSDESSGESRSWGGAHVKVKKLKKTRRVTKMGEVEPYGRGLTQLWIRGSSFGRTTLLPTPKTSAKGDTSSGVKY